jgi:hypothetical protein
MIMIYDLLHWNLFRWNVIRSIHDKFHKNTDMFLININVIFQKCVRLSESESLYGWQSACLGVKPTLWTIDQILLPFQEFESGICCPVSVGRPLWRRLCVSCNVLVTDEVNLCGIYIYIYIYIYSILISRHGSAPQNSNDTTMLLR